MTDDIQPQPKPRAVRVKEIELPDGNKAWEYSDGSIRNANGQPVPGTKIPNTGYEITHENAREFMSRRRAIGLRAQLRGLAKSIGVDPSEVDDELLLQAGNAVEALTTHMSTTFQTSKSLRGMAEVYGVLASPLVGDRRQKDDSEPGNGSQPQIFIMIAQYISSLRDQQPADVIERQFKD